MTSSNVLLWKHVSITSEVIFIFRVDRPDRVYDVEHRAGVDPLLVVAGSEPIEFVASFTVWTSPDKSLKRDDDKTWKPQKLSDVISSLSRLTYSLEELRSKDLPDGVDPNHLETYLSEEDFKKLFEMTKEDFYKLASWKQMKLRREKDFF